jgi:hypothetical protein
MPKNQIFSNFRGRARRVIYRQWQEQDIFNEMMSILFYTNTLSWIVMVLAH